MRIFQCRHTFSVVYRLHGIDAPEAGQKCMKPDGKSWACGKAAISALEELVLGQDVRCDDRGQDDYGRTIGVCTVGTRDINAKMVATGNAWAFRKYSPDYIDLEDKAHQEHVGVWQADTQPPWDYRTEKWAVAEQESPNGCPIKGNISENGYIYHAPCFSDWKFSSQESWSESRSVVLGQLSVKRKSRNYRGGISRFPGTWFG
ncbi:thermonuclease family protein [Sinorhizobium medicae]|uniref:thermonuclease family protein n=1 Tax=Sinorhizobium medicae TaxID=110321 RepID=UPI00396A89B1